jgi:signal transduction histidine kinase
MVDTDGGEGTLRSDASKVRQILTNLVGNAIKFADHGVIGLTVRLDPSGAVSFSVQDTGRGIAAEDLQRIFEEFTQIEDHETAKPGGTGLGLRICQGYAELLGGDLDVASELGVGSMFTLRLPPEPPVAHSASDRDPG